MNLTTEGVRAPFEIYPGIFVPPGTYDHAEGQFVFQTNLGAPASYYLTDLHRRHLRRQPRHDQPDGALQAGRDLHDRDVVQPQRRRPAVGAASAPTSIRSRINYSFTPRAFVQSLLQYNDRADSGR